MGELGQGRKVSRVNWRKMEVCLINFNKGKDDEGCLKILQYSEMEYNCVRKITEGLFRKYSTL